MIFMKKMLKGMKDNYKIATEKYLMTKVIKK